MSGNRGTKRSNSLGRGNRPDTCLILIIETSLLSPNEEVIRVLRKGAKLKVIYDETTTRIQAETVSGEIVGTLASNRTIQLLSCLKAGHKYQAEVMEILGGNCKVKVTHI